MKINPEPSYPLGVAGLLDQPQGNNMFFVLTLGTLATKNAKLFHSLFILYLNPAELPTLRVVPEAGSLLVVLKVGSLVKKIQTCG